MMDGGVQEFLKGAAAKRLAGATEKQREARRRVDERNRQIQSGPIKRGPNAPQSGTFGGVKK